MITDFQKLFKEWDLGVQSMQYLKNKGRIALNDLERFRKLETRMDDAFKALPPFEQETVWSEIWMQKKADWRRLCQKSR